jgi:sulfur-oxidizing protein SoxB
MVRVGGLEYSVTPKAAAGQRINNMMLKGKPIEADKKYKVAGWASVQEGVQGEPIWDLVSGYLRDKKVIKGVKINTPKVIGMEGNPGFAA